MSREIAIGQLHPHPLNSNRMTAAQLKKLERHIARTGRYEPLVVRPLGVGEDAGCAAGYQVLNGHHRLEVLRRLRRETARCEVWEVDEGEGRLLLATLNRLQGRDDPTSRAALLAELADGRANLAELAKLLPEDRAALDKALALAREAWPRPAVPQTLAPLFRPLTFFLTDAEAATVEPALRAAGRGAEAENVKGVAGRLRSAALVRLAEAFMGRGEV